MDFPCYIRVCRRTEWGLMVRLLCMFSICIQFKLSKMLHLKMECVIEYFSQRIDRSYFHAVLKWKQMPCTLMILVRFGEFY